MSIHSLVKTQADPDVDRDDMQVLGQVAVQKRTADGTRSKDKNLKRVGKLGGETERCAVSVVELVDVTIQRAVVQSLVS